MRVSCSLFFLDDLALGRVVVDVELQKWGWSAKDPRICSLVTTGSHLRLLDV